MVHTAAIILCLRNRKTHLIVIANTLSVGHREVTVEEKQVK